MFLRSVRMWLGPATGCIKVYCSREQPLDKPDETGSIHPPWWVRSVCEQQMHNRNAILDNEATSNNLRLNPE